MSPLQAQLDRIRRRRWLIVAVMVVAMVGTVVFSLLAGSSYTGRAALSVTSDRTPEQDASLALGYVEYFNQDFAQDTLRERTDLAGEVSFEARSSATSPIIYIEATAPDVEQATQAAGALAAAFRDDINQSIAQQSERPIADLRAELEAAQARLAEVPANGQQSSLISNEIGNIQSRIQQIQTETFNNQLKDLSLNAGVTSQSPKPIQNAVLGLVGGLILGVVLALALATAEDRLTSPQQVRERLNLDTLARIKRAGGEELREQQLKSLANVVSLSDMSRPAILAVTSVRSAELSSEVAEGLAYYRAQQGERTLLIRADLESARQRGAHSGRPGLGDFLAGGPGMRLQPLVVPSGLGRMLVLPAGSSRDDPYALFGPERFHDAIQQASHLADLIVIDAPAIVDAAEAQVICASADRTILVVAEGMTRASDAVEARERLERVHAEILGVVIGQSGADRTESSAARSAAASIPSAGSAGSASNGAYDEIDIRA
ncbi:CpsD/CapB family tyrosine-protein kinase [Pseudonocardia sp. H11422]|uniref:CpsD/CapB family tyrosine-protein kinase n=1 Tax=Pseudonocardia sp. H11422 TaxID=2835866 RepID=UPI001BDC1D71|nr:CpsD/CapB family tyrosine-protein kinase [Pseudonocardia sp. H11422]